MAGFCKTLFAVRFRCPPPLFLTTNLPARLHFSASVWSASGKCSGGRVERIAERAGAKRRRRTTDGSLTLLRHLQRMQARDEREVPKRNGRGREGERADPQPVK